MIDFIPLPYKIAGIALVMVICAVLGYMKGYENANSKYLAFKADVAAQTAILEANAEKARLESERVTLAVSKSWASALNSVRADYSSRLRNAGCKSPVRPVSVAASESSEGTSDSGLGASTFEAQCRQLESDCAETTGQLMWLQQWTIEQSEVQR